MESFCGVGNVPEGMKRGTAKECIDKGQVRYYGVEKFDKKLLGVANIDKLKTEIRNLGITVFGLEKRFKKEKEVFDKVKEKLKGNKSKEALKEKEMRKKAVKKTIKQHENAKKKLKEKKADLAGALKELESGGGVVSAKAKKGVVKQVKAEKAKVVPAVAKAAKSKTVRFPINDIKKEINSGDKVFWFLIGPNKGVMIAKGENKTEAGKNLLDIIDKKRDKFMGRELLRISLSTHDERGDDPAFGDVLARLENYKVMEGAKKINVKKQMIADKFGPVWFTKKWLEYNGWKNEYIRNIANKVISGNVKMKLTGQNFYDAKFI